MYDGIKKAVGPAVKRTAPLKSTTGETTVDQKEQMVRWVEHYSELYAKETTVTEAALSSNRRPARDGRVGHCAYC